MHPVLGKLNSVYGCKSNAIRVASRAGGISDERMLRFSQGSLSTGEASRWLYISHALFCTWARDRCGLIQLCVNVLGGSFPVRTPLQVLLCFL